MHGFLLKEKFIYKLICILFQLLVLHFHNNLVTWIRKKPSPVLKQSAEDLKETYA